MPPFSFPPLIAIAAIGLPIACSTVTFANDATSAATKRNILLICVDDLRPELKSFGAEYIHSPNIDRLAASGRAFHRHYVNAPTCGASRFTFLTGQYGPSSNQALFMRAEKLEAGDTSIQPSMPEWFRKNGYTTVSVGKVSHHPGGWGGEDWNDETIIEMPNAWNKQVMPTGLWKTPRGAMHSLSNGETRSGRPFTENKMDPFQSAEGSDTSYHDGLIAEAGIEQLNTLAQSDTPFFLVIGLIKPHLPFGAPARYMEHYKNIEFPPIPHSEKPDWQSTWHQSGEFFTQYNHYGKDPRINPEYADEVRRHYAACVSYADKLVGDIIDKLKESGKAEDTIIVLWGDHGWNLGEHAIWGKHNLFEEALRSPLIISFPDMEKPGEKTDAIVETTDLFPTLCDLSGLQIPNYAQGVSLLQQLEDPNAKGHSAYSYYGKAQTIRDDQYRLTLHDGGYAELYDHSSQWKESKNLAEQLPEQVENLKRILNEKRKHDTNK